MHFSKYKSAQHCRSPSMRVLGLFSSPYSPPLERSFGHSETHLFLPPVADISNVTSPAPIVSPPSYASDLKLPPLPGLIPILPFRDVAPYHLLSPDHPLNAPSSLSLPRSSPPAESFDDALAFSQASFCSSASAVEPPIGCKELGWLDESDTETWGESPPGTSESPQIRKVAVFGSLSQESSCVGSPNSPRGLPSDSVPVQIVHDSWKMSISGILNPQPAAVKCPSPAAATHDSRMRLDAIINNDEIPASNFSHPFFPFATVESYSGKAERPNRHVHKPVIYHNDVDMDLGHNVKVESDEDVARLPPWYACKDVEHCRMW